MSQGLSAVGRSIAMGATQHPFPIATCCERPEPWAKALVHAPALPARLAAALDALDVPCETRYYQGQGRAFHALNWREQANSGWRHSLRFITGLDVETATP